MPALTGGFPLDPIGGIMGHVERLQKITFADVRDIGVRGLLIYRCSHPITMSGDRWLDDVRLSDLEQRFICSACGKRGADVRPDFNWNAKPMMGYR